MSGPKISATRVSKRKYQVKSDTEKKRESINTLNICSRKFKNRIKELEKMKDALEVIYECQEKSDMLLSMNKLISDMEKMIEEAKTVNINSNVKDAHSIAQKQFRFSVSIDNKVIPLKRKINKLTIIDRQIVDNEEDKKILEALGESFYIPFVDDRFKYLLQKELESINIEFAKVNAEIMNKELKNEFLFLKDKASEIKNAEYMHNFYQMSVIPFVRKCLSYQAYYEDNIQCFEEAKINNELLCERLGIPFVNYEFSEESIKYYLKNNEELESKEDDRLKQEYLIQTMNKVMNDMGYDLVGKREVKNKKAQVTRNELFSFDQGTVVNVTYGKNGQICMEIGGVSQEDRLPTDIEKDKLVSSMKNFCSNYERIEKKLEENGIQNNRLSVMPASEEFAQIINVKNYNMEKAVEDLQTENISVQQQNSMYEDL